MISESEQTRPLAGFRVLLNSDIVILLNAANYRDTALLSCRLNFILNVKLKVILRSHGMMY